VSTNAIELDGVLYSHALKVPSKDIPMP
jgi:hypothetical protein